MPDGYDEILPDEEVRFTEVDVVSFDIHLGGPDHDEE